MNAMASLNQLLPWLEGSRLLDDRGGAVSFKRVHSDSRSVEPGDLFVALQGPRFDANQFFAQARQRGAVAVLCQDDGGGGVAQRLRAESLAALLVPDARKALGQLARHWRAQFDLPLIAVTGSNGKTTVTQMIAAILAAAHGNAFLATQGNFNNDIGVPLTLLRLRGEHRMAVIELGMNHPGEIAALAALAQPTVALVNNAQREHLEFMTSVPAVARENGCVIEALPAHGMAVFPADDAFSPLWCSVAGARSLWRFLAPVSAAAGTAAAEVRATQARWLGNAWQVQAQTPVGDIDYRLPIAGWHNLRNSLAALSAAAAAGVALAAVAAGLSAFTSVPGRCRTQQLDYGGHRFTLVDDSYNANPDSVRAAIELLATLPAPRLLVLGDMGEVGQQGAQFHAEAGALARQHGLDDLFTLGELSGAATKSFAGGQHFSSIEALQDALLAQLGQLGSVLVKGSRFMKMERLVRAIEAQAHSARRVPHAA